MNVDSLLTLEGISIHITRLNIALENFPENATEEQLKMKEDSEEQVKYWLEVLRRSKGLIK
jgi:GH35 family endo-1,4-beta-xylanase